MRNFWYSLQLVPGIYFCSHSTPNDVHDIVISVFQHRTKNPMSHYSSDDAFHKSTVVIVAAEIIRVAAEFLKKRVVFNSTVPPLPLP